MAESHRYWRLYVYETAVTRNRCEIREVEFRASVGGADQTGSGTAIASSNTNPTYPASEAFDNATASSISDHWRADHNDLVPSYIGYDFGSSTPVVQWAIMPNAANYQPINHGLQYSDDGTNWTELRSVTYTAFSAGVLATLNYTDPPAGVSATTAAVQVIPGTDVGQAISTAGVYVVIGKIDLRKAHGYAVLTSANDRIGLQKAMGYAVLNGQTELWVRKAYGYAVLHDTSINLTGRRRALTVAG